MLHTPSRTILHSRFYMPLAHYGGMDLRQRIDRAMKAKDLTLRGVSLAAGLSDSMLHKFMTGQTRSITVDNLEKVAEALGVSLRHLMFGDPDEEKVSYIWDHIPERRRQQALQVLQTFADDNDNGSAESA